MKVFVATEAPKGKREYSHTAPGELVHFPPLMCDCPDCGCRWGMCGFASHRATSAFVVRDIDLDLTTYTRLLWETLRDGGWVTDGNAGDRRWVEEWAVDHVEAAAAFPAEAPLRVREGEVTLRSRPVPSGRANRR